MLRGITMSWGMARRSAVPAVGDICRDDIEDYKVLLAARSAATLLIGTKVPSRTTYAQQKGQQRNYHSITRWVARIGQPSLLWPGAMHEDNANLH